MKKKKKAHRKKDRAIEHSRDIDDIEVLIPTTTPVRPLQDDDDMKKEMLKLKTHCILL